MTSTSTQNPKITPLRKEAHGALKISHEKAYAHVAQEHLLPVTAHEFVLASAEYPIVFVKNEQKNIYQPVVLLGLSAKQNVFVDDGDWQGIYIPVAARNYPLALVRDAADSELLFVAIDESSPRVVSEGGEALFNEDGTESKFLIQRKEHMAEFIELSKVTAKFTAKLQSLDLFKQQILTLKVQNEEQRINGVYLVDEQKLADLDDETLLDLHRSGYLKVIYAHLLSLQQTQKLVRKIDQAS